MGPVNLTKNDRLTGEKVYKFCQHFYMYEDFTKKEIKTQGGGQTQ